MARTPSNMISLGSIAPDFNLIDVTSDSNFSLKENKGTIGTVIMFICNHCPYVKHVNPTISKLAKGIKVMKSNLLLSQVMMSLIIPRIVLKK